MNRMRGYIEIEFGGQIRPVKFGVNALALFSERNRMTLVDLEKMSIESLTLTQLRDLIFIGLKEGCRVNAQQCEFNEENVGDWIDETGMDGVSKIMEAFHAAMAAGSTKKKATEENLKN